MRSLKSVRAYYFFIKEDMGLLFKQKIQNAFSRGKGILCLLLFFLFLNFQSCALDAPENGYDYLAPPVITKVASNGQNIIIEFRGHNEEYYFDGYNVYVSPDSMYRTNITKYTPVQIEGYASAEPSYPLSPEDYNPDELRTMTLYHYWRHVEDTGEDILNPFERGVSYYILLCSHHRLLGVDDEGVSNQIEIFFE